MVQRKLGLQADLAKPEKGLASQLKPSSSLQEANKSMRSADFKKKIKKSRSMKLSDIKTLKPSSSSSSVKHDSKLPNYMKATSSSVARKEHTQQQQQQPQVSTNIKKHGSGSCNKPARTLTKSSSLKSVRTLTKTPSFKPARASSSAKKKRSEVALCADIDMQKATCSSTLKDSKFPDFLKLNPGGTEAEGTSVMKVCPYLYCSLNGHHHKPSPPLKMFLKAKRRVLKTQKNAKKIEASDPCRVRLIDDDGDENGSSRPVIIDDKPGYEDADADMEFYVEIYAKNKVVVVDDERQVAESISDGSPKSEIDFEEGLEEHKVDDENEDEETQIGSVQEDAMMGKFCFESESEEDFEASMDVDDTVSEAIDMEWDEVDKEAIYSIQIEDLSYLKVGFSMEAENLDVQGEVEIISNVSSCNEDDALQEQEVIEDAVAQLDPQLEDDEAYNGALDHQQETELEAKDEVAEFKLSDEALDHQQETELEAKDEVAEFKLSDEALDHQQETELEAKDEVAELILTDGALDHQQETESEARDEVAEDCAIEEDTMEAQDKANPELKSGFARTQSKEALPETNCNRKWSIGCKRSMEESKDESEFNPREPNFLPLIPDPEAEKVDLRHQMMDERKNSDEWMLDYALQQTVTKLAPARKRKVALLVEAFESVLPVPRYHQAAAFAHARPIQACN